MAAAREEFMEKGYEKASMRSIADRCGMTAAGIYRHCRDKEDLFSQIVSPAADKLIQSAKEHMYRYEEPVKRHEKIIWKDSHIDLMREVVYPDMDDFHLLIAKSEGSRYENFLHDLTQESQNRFLSYLKKMKSAGYKVPKISPKQMHLLMTAYMTALFEPVVHHYTYKDAIEALATLEVFFLPGWKQLMDL